MSLFPRRALLAASLAVVATPALAADFAACFTLTPDVSWSVGAETTQITAARYADAPALAVITSGSGLARANVFDATGRTLLTTVHYGVGEWDPEGNPATMTDTFDPAPTFPATAKPGQRFTVTGKVTRENHVDETEREVEYDGFEDFTFVGFEDLEAEVDGAARTFKDTCHLTASVEGGRAEMWYAPGLGRIKFQRYSGDMLLMGDEIDSLQAE